jgi:DNA-binding HxlR family transcriptional regulator
MMKGKRTDLGGAACGIARALEVVGDWWSLLLVREAFHGQQRFSDFEKRLGIARNILSKRLKKMIEEDIFRTEPDRDGRSRRYILTEKGEDLYVLLIALWQWGEEHCFETGEPGHVLVDRIGGRPLPRMRPLSASGKIVRPRDFQLSAREKPPVAAE